MRVAQAKLGVQRAYKDAAHVKGMADRREAEERQTKLHNLEEHDRRVRAQMERRHAKERSILTARYETATNDLKLEMRAERDRFSRQSVNAHRALERKQGIIEEEIAANPSGVPTSKAMERVREKLSGVTTAVKAVKGLMGLLKARKTVTGSFGGAQATADAVAASPEVTALPSPPPVVE